MNPTFSAEARRAARLARRRRNILLVVGGVVLIIVLIGAWVGIRGVLAKNELQAAVPLASKVQARVVANDQPGARKVYKEFAEHAASAASLTSDPIWRAAEVVPFVGPNLTAFRQLADTVNFVSTDALKPVIDITGQVKLSDFKPVNGAIDVAPLVSAQPGIAKAAKAFTAAQTELRAINTKSTVGAVRDATSQLGTALDSAADAANSVNNAVKLVPAMLGTDGPRNYLLLFQNLAEMRSTGGLAGAVALIHTENGKITLAQQASSAVFPHYKNGVVALPSDTLGLYGSITAEYIQDVNLTPRFPLSATIAREMWRLKFGTQTNGVLSIDPIALSYLLKATGPITLPTGDVITSSNAVKLLLSDVYARYTVPADQDTFFAQAAAAVFNSVAAGKADPDKLIQALARAGDERRVYVWNADPAEQKVLAATTLAGDLPVSGDRNQTIGVYLNDNTGAKMGPYLKVTIASGQTECRVDGRPYYGVSITLKNTAPANAATALPPYVVGSGTFGVPPGSVGTIVTAYGPTGSLGLKATQDGAPAKYQPTLDGTYAVGKIDVQLKPGQSSTVQFGWLGAKPFEGKVDVSATPGIHVSAENRATFTCQSPIW